MTTKYNTGDQVLIPATITAAKQTEAGIIYEVAADWEIPEGYIQTDSRAIGASMQAFAEALPRRERF